MTESTDELRRVQALCAQHNGESCRKRADYFLACEERAINISVRTWNRTGRIYAQAQAAKHYAKARHLMGLDA